MATYATSANQIATLKELYKDDRDVLKDMVYAENPLFAMIPKDESIDGLSGKYMPIPITYGVPQGRSHTFANAQSNQSPSSNASYFVAVIQDYELVTITNLLMEQTKTSAGAFIDQAKYQVDGGFRNLSNNIAFELFADGTGTRGFVGTGGSNPSGSIYVIPLSNAQQVVQFEIGMTLVNFTKSSTAISAISSTTAAITAVNRASGVITVLASGTDSTWTTAGKALGVQGDVVAGTISTTTNLGLSGLDAWIPKVSPTSTPFWAVDRSVDPTRLGGLRFDASAYTIEEGVTNALAFMSREGARPDIAVMDFASYAALVNSLGAKVQYVQLNHDEVEVAFEGIAFNSAYGRITVLADRSCPPQTCYILTMSTLKLRSLGRVPHILRYGMEGLEGLRTATSDALEVRIGYYGNLTCNAPGWNCVVSLSA